MRELARTLQRGKSTVQRTLSALAAAGLVSFNPRNEKYGLGPGIIRLAAPYLKDRGVSTRSLPIMKRLRDMTGETVTLSVAIDQHRVIIQQVESLRELKWTGRVGYPYPIHTGATGKCLMAHLPEPWLRELLSRGPLERYTPLTLTEPEEILGAIRTIREHGYATSFGEWFAGGAGLAVPVEIDEGRPPAVLGLYGPVSRLTPEKMHEYLPALREAAAAIGTGTAPVAAGLDQVEPQQHPRSSPVMAWGVVETRKDLLVR